MVGRWLSPEETEPKATPSVIPLLRLARGLMLLLAALVCYLIYIWYNAQSFWWADGTFEISATIAIFASFAFGSYELYYGVKFIRIPTSNMLSFESNSILLLSIISEALFILFSLGSLWIFSTPQLFLAFVVIHFSIYMSLFLLEVRILYSEFSSRPKNIPEYIKEKYRSID